MSKAEERALEAYPKETRDIDGIVVDIGHPQYMRDLYIEGYHKAEKDLELTWEDIEEIYFLVIETDNAYMEANAQNDYQYDVKEMYQEVLKRFKDLKEK